MTSGGQFIARFLDIFVIPQIYLRIFPSMTPGKIAGAKRFSTVHCPLPPVHRNHGRSVGAGNAGQEHAHQPDHKFRVACRRDHIRQPAEDLDAVVGIAELDLAQILSAKGLLLHGLRGVGGDIYPLIGQGERGLADDKMIAGLDAEPIALLAQQKYGISGIRQAE